MKVIDLNVDIGEGFPFDAELLRFATSANVCCGVHAGSPELTASTVELCLSRGVRVGAHPGYPDREAMGRLTIDTALSVAEWLDSVDEQIRWFSATFPAAYVKPHGAFYNDTGLLSERGKSASPNLVAARERLQLVMTAVDLPLMGLPNTTHEGVSSRFIREGFADRKYKADGTLTPRTEPGAVLHDPKEIAKQVVLLTNQVNSICLHGDTEGAVEFAELIYATLLDAGFQVRA